MFTPGSRLMQKYDRLVDISYERFGMNDGSDLIDLLTSEEWPFHADADPDKLRQRVAGGRYADDTALTFWVLVDGNRAGFIQLFDLDDDTPMFDIRLQEDMRGRGIGTEVIAWVIEYVFREFPRVNRLEATTRDDNIGMRKVLLGNGFAKEAHYRQSWPGLERLHDSIGYAILRTDWEAGVVTPVPWDDDPTM